MSIIKWYKNILIFLCLLRVKLYLEGGQSVCPGIPFWNKSCRIKIIKQNLVWVIWRKKRWIWLFNKLTLTKLIMFGSVRDNLRRCTIVSVKRGVYKVTDMDFRCCKDADNFKNTVDHFGGQNHQFSNYYSIFTSK